MMRWFVIGVFGSLALMLLWPVFLNVGRKIATLFGKVWDEEETDEVETVVPGSSGSASGVRERSD